MSKERYQIKTDEKDSLYHEIREGSILGGTLQRKTPFREQEKYPLSKSGSSEIVDFMFKVHAIEEKLGMYIYYGSYRFAGIGTFTSSFHELHYSPDTGEFHFYLEAPRQGVPGHSDTEYKGILKVESVSNDNSGMDSNPTKVIGRATTNSTSCILAASTDSSSRSFEGKKHININTRMLDRELVCISVNGEDKYIRVGSIIVGETQEEQKDISFTIAFILKKKGDSRKKVGIEEKLDSRKKVGIFVNGLKISGGSAQNPNRIYRFLPAPNNDSLFELYEDNRKHTLVTRFFISAVTEHMSGQTTLSEEYDSGDEDGFIPLL